MISCTGRREGSSSLSMSKLEKSWTTSLYVASPNSVHRLLTGRDTRVFGLTRRDAHRKISARLSSG